MSIETDCLAEIAGVALGERPLIVSDVDEVVFEFISPFSAFLAAQGCRLLPRSFRLHGNIVCEADGVEIEAQRVTDLIDAFFGDQNRWQKPACDAVETLHALSADHDIVFLTAMKPHHKALRRAALDSFGLHFPMIATEGPKGLAVRELHRNRALPVIFVDDIDRNLQSVAEEVPSCLLIRMIANADFRSLAAPPAAGVETVAGWRDLAVRIQTHCSAENRG